MATAALGQQRPGAPGQTPPEFAQQTQEQTPQAMEQPPELTEQQRQRLRESYLAALEAQERARREANEPQSSLLVPDRKMLDKLIGEMLRQGREISRIPQQTQAQLQQLQQTLGEQQRQMQRQLDKLRGQMIETNTRLADLARQATPAPASPAAPPSQALEQLRRQGKAIESTLDKIALQQQELQHYLQMVDRDLGDLERQQEDIAGEWDAAYRHMGGLRDAVQAVRRQQQEIQARVARLEERMNAAGQQGDENVQAIHNELRDLRASLMQVRGRIERLEPAPFEAESATQAQLDDLQGRVGDLQMSLVQTQTMVNSMLCQSGRSTVGSAGYTWGW